MLENFENVNLRTFNQQKLNLSNFNIYTIALHEIQHFYKLGYKFLVITVLINLNYTAYFKYSIYLNVHKNSCYRDVTSSTIFKLIVTHFVTCANVFHSTSLPLSIFAVLSHLSFSLGGFPPIFTKPRYFSLYLIINFKISKDSHIFAKFELIVRILRSDQQSFTIMKIMSFKERNG